MGSFFKNLRNKMERFMCGRYGLDQLGRFLSGALIVCLLLSLFLDSRKGVGQILYFVGFFLLIWSYFRMFSKNTAKRYQENVKFLTIKNRISGPLTRSFDHLKQRRTHVFFKCPSCGQKMRTPKGQGEKHVTCPKCRTQFTKRT